MTADDRLRTRSRSIKHGLTRVALAIGIALLCVIAFRAWLAHGYLVAMEAAMGPLLDPALADREADRRAINHIADLAAALCVPIAAGAVYVAIWIRAGVPASLGRPVWKLHTSRLLLRRFRYDDLDAMHAILSDAETLRYWDAPPHASLDQTQGWLVEMSHAPSRFRDNFAIEHDGEVIGMLGSTRLPWVGFVFARPTWGKGLATEALEAFTTYMFQRRGIAYLVAQTDLRNSLARALLGRAGFHEIGCHSITRENTGEAVDIVSLRLNHPDYAESAAASNAEG